MDVTFNFVMAILAFSLPYIFTWCNLSTISKTVSCNQHQANVVPSFPEYNGTLRYLEFKGQWIIRDLDYNSFKDAPLSEKLILQNIGLKHLSCDVFNNIIPELQILNLDDNLLDYFPACSLNTLWRLRTLTLSRNFIQCIPEHSMPGFLTHLDVSNNKIYSLSSDLSTDVHNKNQLKTLIIRGNNLRRINENKLNQFSSLKYLDASENQLDYINSVSFLSSGSQLRDINLSHNQLTGTVWLCLEYTLEVRNLNLSHNLIELVNETTLSNMKSLQKLEISYNILTSVGPAFVDQKDILLLLFQHNAITSVSRELFSTRSGFMETFTIDLSFNSLASLDLGIPECFNCTVSVHHNKLRTTDLYTVSTYRTRHFCVNNQKTFQIFTFRLNCHYTWKTIVFPLDSFVV
ncbi:Chondroadherin-like protein [Mizuhopecten yessoensis]|uniref:Chondroadherin-like protein n=1 Tax=Mizuhopecten yessoensis TaxID=6573 RepID=A0A210PY11_MIZYE|nr:Chondroadherin-like protein [Mizuhopecten yessoensis]